LEARLGDHSTERGTTEECSLAALIPNQKKSGRGTPHHQRQEDEEDGE